MLTTRTTLALLAVASTAVGCKAPQHRTDEPVNPQDQPVGTAETYSTPTTVSALGDASTKEGPLEGRLSFQMVGRPAETFDYAIAGDKIRIGIASTSGTGKGVDAIVDEKSKEATVVARDQKTYSKMSLDKLKEPQPEDLGKNVKVDKTGKTSLVAGHTCEEWKLTGPQYQVQACVMKAGAGFDLQALGKIGNATPPAWLDRVVDEGYVPLRVAIGDAQGNAIPGAYGEWSTTRVDPLVFEPPKDFKEKPAPKGK